MTVQICAQCGQQFEPKEKIEQSLSRCDKCLSKINLAL